MGPGDQVQRHLVGQLLLVDLEVQRSLVEQPVRLVRVDEDSRRALSRRSRSMSSGLVVAG